MCKLDESPVYGQRENFILTAAQKQPKALNFCIYRTLKKVSLWAILTLDPIVGSKTGQSDI